MARSRLELAVNECLDRLLSPSLRLQCVEAALSAAQLDDLPSEDHAAPFIARHLVPTVRALVDDSTAQAVAEDLGPLFQQRQRTRTASAPARSFATPARRTRKPSVEDPAAVAAALRGHTLSAPSPRERPAAQASAPKAAAIPRSGTHRDDQRTGAAAGPRLRPRIASDDSSDWRLNSLAPERGVRLRVICIGGQPSIARELQNHLADCARISAAPNLLALLTDIDIGELGLAALVYDLRHTSLAESTGMAFERLPSGLRVILWGLRDELARDTVLKHAGHLEWMACSADAEPREVATLVRLMLTP